MNSQAAESVIANQMEPDSAALSGKRILYILPQPFFLTRGSSFRALATIKGMAGLGLNVDVVAYPLGDVVDLDGVRLHRSIGIPGLKHVPIGPSWRKILLDKLLFWRCLWLALSRRYDLFHGVEEGGIIAAVLAKITGTPYIFDMHSWMSMQLEDAGFTKPRVLLEAFRKIERACIGRASAVITVGAALTERVGKLAPQVFGLTLEDYALQLTEEELSAGAVQLRRELGLGAERILLYTGNFESYQGIDLLLQGFSLVVRSGRVADLPKLLLVGGGDHGSAIVARYRELARELGIEQQVIFAGQRAWHEMGRFMGLADVLVSPRIHGENTPLKIYSYMAAGKIIVATRINSHTQVLSDETAFLADPVPEALARCLEAVLDDSPHTGARKLACLRRAKLDVEARYSEKEFSRRIGQCYQRVLGQRQAQIAKSPER